MDDAVELHLPMGEVALDAFVSLGEVIGQAVEDAGLGHVDAGDAAGGVFSLYLTGPAGDALLRRARHLIPPALLQPGAHALIRHTGDDEIIEVRISLAARGSTGGRPGGRAPSERSGDDASEGARTGEGRPWWEIPAAGTASVSSEAAGSGSGSSVSGGPERARRWRPVAFGQIVAGETANTRAFGRVLREVWRALPEMDPTGPNSTTLAVTWHLEGRLTLDLHAAWETAIDDRAQRRISAMVPVANRARTPEECRALIRQSLLLVSGRARQLVRRHGLRWETADADRVVRCITAELGRGGAGDRTRGDRDLGRQV